MNVSNHLLAVLTPRGVELGIKKNEEEEEEEEESLGETELAMCLQG